MNERYYNDYYAPFFSSESYPVDYNRNSYFGGCYRNENNTCSSDNLSISNKMDAFYNPTEGFSKGNMQANTYKPYKLVNPGLPLVSNDRERLLLEVQKFGFAMWDLNLYLNTHPTDKNAMMLFDQYRNSYKRAANEYENKYGPLELASTNTNTASWEWNKSPWPWEVQ